MPSATVYTVDPGPAKWRPVSSYSYADGETFADARLNLQELFEFEFQFNDVSLASPMLTKWERFNRLGDCGGKIYLIPKDSDVRLNGLCGDGQIEPDEILGSSNASNAPSVTVTDGCPDVGVEPAIDVSSVVVEAAEGNFASELMSNDLKSHWASAFEKLKIHMGFIQCSDHKWKVKTWDKDNVPYGHIECCECGTTVDGTSKGVMDKVSINNAFVNFRSKHLRSAKHAGRVASNRGEKVNNRELGMRAQSNILGDRALLEQHVGIVQRANEKAKESQTLPHDTFTILGDKEKDPLELHKFRILCNFCIEHLTFIPKQRNLEYNLEQHSNSVPHLDRVRRSQVTTRGDPVLSGRPGRPRVADARDVRQRTIRGFLTRVSSGGASSSSSRASAAEEERGTCVSPQSLLCWGLWGDEIPYGSETRPIKGILLDQFKEDGVWWAEPFVRENVLCYSTTRECTINGTFRHMKCSRLSQLGGGFENLMCEMCFSIAQEPDFRKRVAREAKAMEKRGSRGTGKGRRIGYLTIPECQNQAKNYRNIILRERKLARILSHKLLMLKSPIPTVREVCLHYQEPNKAAILKCCQSIVLAHKRGAFRGRGALWDLLSDIASNLNRKKQGYRYKPGTKLLCQTLFLHGGRRVVDCLASNGISPTINTLQRDKKGMTVFRAGLHAEQFKFISHVYSQLKKRLNICLPVPCMLAEDETCVKRTVRWLPKHDTLLGFCGSKVNHECEAGLEIEVGEGEAGFNTIADAFENCVVGHQARCVIVNPLATGFPKLCVLATATCNRFDAGWVRRQWNDLQSLWNTHCLEAIGPLLGHASDGDSRRRKLMLQDYTGRGIVGRRKNLKWDGWILTHSMTTDEPIRASGLHDQDYIHNGKKLVNPLDSTVRILKLGSEMARLSHFIHLYDLYEVADHGLNHEDILRTDRQNWASAQRLCSPKVIRTLRLLRLRKDARVELTLGTELYVRICADYLDIFLNTTLSLRERIVLCGKVGFFFRIWRLWCFHGNHKVGGNTQSITFARNCIPMQTFLDIQISVHFVVLLILQFRDNFRHLPVPLHLTGSDACEQFFSKVGGMRGHERSYDLGELVECATNLNRLAAMDLTEGMMGVGKSHKKHSNIWMKLQVVEGAVPLEADQADYTGIETDAEVVSALKEGLVLAQSTTTELEMNPSTSCREKVWWSTPWKVEAKGVKFGGWCDVNVDLLVDSCDDCLDEVRLDPASSSAVVSQEVVREDAVPPVTGLFAGPEVHVAGAEVEATMNIMHSELVYGAPIKDVKPIVHLGDRQMYKSTMVSQLIGNPHLSKDRLTRVKQSIYFNNLVDKPNYREGVQTMFMTVGSDCGVYFLDDKPQEGRATRSAKAIATALKRKGRASKRIDLPTQTGKKQGKNLKRPRGQAVPVMSLDVASASKYVWWIGRVQSIHRKYGKSIARSREPVDLLDRPVSEDACHVVFNWFTPSGSARHKFSYSMCDPQSISLDCVIQTVNLTVDPLYPTIFQLHPDEVVDLDNFEKRKLFDASTIGVLLIGKILPAACEGVMKQGTSRLQKKQGTSRLEKKQGTSRLQKKQGTSRLQKKQGTTKQDGSVGHEVNDEGEMGRLKRKYEMDEALMNLAMCREIEEAEGSYVCRGDDGSCKIWKQSGLVQALVTPSNIKFSTVPEFRKDYVFWPAILPVLISETHSDSEDELEAVVYTFGNDGHAGIRIGFGCSAL